MDTKSSMDYMAISQCCPKEELYDIKSDPLETLNLVSEPQYSEVLNMFRNEMADWREQQGDNESGPYQPHGRQSENPMTPYIFDYNVEFLSISNHIFRCLASLGSHSISNSSS